ncbi:MAG TPA: dihydropteroate synthase, partial [Tepidisphaeraceae bacterium]|nr:dihydropteroate synthase [Tepidisphaeraceae bacterium]
FSDGGRFADADAAIAHAQEMVAKGADWIDVGAESTRPGSQRVGAAEQLARLGPVLGELRQRVPVVLSIDTTLAAVAEAALDAGVDVVNDISAGRDDPALLPMVARRGVAVVLMHMQGEPATMQVAPHYADVTAEVCGLLRERAAVAESAGVAAHNVLLDPGIGFGKTVAHNLRLLRDLPVLASAGKPVVVGTSRKGFIGKVTGEDRESGRLFGTAATTAWAAANGAAVVRVHDVGEMARVVRMVRAIREATG